MGEINKRFHFDSVCGDTGLIDEEAEMKWWITNVCSVTDLKDNWISACDKLNELAEENERLKQKLEEYNKSKFICPDCEYGGYTDIGCFCEKEDCWVEFINKCENYKEIDYGV